MKKLIITAALLVVPTLALAEAGNGIDLSWNDCVLGSAGTAAVNKNFVCTTGGANQNYSLILQFKVSRSYPSAYAWTANLDYANRPVGPYPYTTPNGNIPDFYHYESSTPCSGGSSGVSGLGISAAPPASCTDNGYADVSGGGLDPVVLGFVYFPDTDQFYNPTPGRSKINAGLSRASENPLEAGLNYFLLSMVFNNRNRANAGCPGCNQLGLILWNNLTIESTQEASVDLHGADKFLNCTEPANVANSPIATMNNQSPDCLATPVKSTTWGKLKSMYR